MEGRKEKRSLHKYCNFSRKKTISSRHINFNPSIIFVNISVLKMMTHFYRYTLPSSHQTHTHTHTHTQNGCHCLSLLMLRVKKLIVIAIVVKLLLLPLLLMLSLPFVEEFFLWSMGSSCRASVDLVSYILKKCVGWDCLGPFFFPSQMALGKRTC